MSMYDFVYKMNYKSGCTCEKEHDSIKLFRKNNWRVRHRLHNHSHFESPKGAAHHSERSTVICLQCGMLWRTKAKYVYYIKDEDLHE